MPGYRAWNPFYKTNEVGLKYVDHMVGNVGWGQMNTWIDFYKDVMGFRQLISFDDKDISTEYTALMSKVVANGNDRIKFPINEPAEGKKVSQIEEYINFYHGAGVQHLAMATDNIVATVTELKNRGVEFLYVPETYYDDIMQRVGEIEEDFEEEKAQAANTGKYNFFGYQPSQNTFANAKQISEESPVSDSKTWAATLIAKIFSLFQ